MQKRGQFILPKPWNLLPVMPRAIPSDNREEWLYLSHISRRVVNGLPFFVPLNSRLFALQILKTLCLHKLCGLCGSEIHRLCF